MAQASRGRPRSEEARRAILTAARDLILESGYSELTIQAIADRSGSGRQTIYRWWSSKALIAADLILSGEITLPSQTLRNTGSLERDLREWLEGIAEAMADASVASLLRALITAASDDPEEAKLLYSMSTGPYHEGIVERLKQGKAAGQLRESADAGAVADALIGTVLFGALTTGARTSTPASVVHALIGS
jgi:AcrR family transcriptional regulator